MISFALLSLALAAGSNSSPLSTYTDEGAHLRPFAFSLAPLITPNVPSTRIINDSYIVVLKDGHLSSHLEDVQSELFAYDALQTETVGGGLKHIWDLDGLKGYAGVFTDETVAALRGHPDIEYIERDQLVHTMDYVIQKNAPWGLARISHREKLSFSNFKKYEYDNDGGDGVNVYVIDTGINIHHEEFEGRARWGKTIPKNDADVDGNGHGTHVAGTIASRKYGVAKKANVIAVKVLRSDGYGSASDILSGIEWVVNDAKEQKEIATCEQSSTRARRHKGSVANMSLGANGKSRALDQAVNAGVMSGVHFVVAAGNNNGDACAISPSGAGLPIAVGAMTLGDQKASFSNHGECVDVFAPGLDILSSWNGPNNNSVNTISGTSMASPHAAGLVAYLLSLYPSSTLAPIAGVTLDNLENNLLLSTVPTFAALFQMSKATLPSWMTVFLPTVTSRVRPPTPNPWDLTPEMMKKAVIAISTNGVLSNLPLKTANRLIYNNVTSLMEVGSSGEFWASL